MIERAFKGSIVVAGGGTGGHLFPGIAVIEELRRRMPSLSVTFVGTARGIESRVLPGMGESLEILDVTPLKGTTTAELVTSLMRLPRAWARCVSILRAKKPDIVLGVGGYASGPMLIAAATLGIPTAILEQNAHVGLTNRLLAPMVGRAYLTFEETRATFGDKARIVGNPVRRAFVDAARIALSDPDGFEARARKLLVIGGSQGAQRLNETVPGALAKALAGANVEVVHQTGAKMVETVRAEYERLGLRAEVVPFIDDMARAYASAQLVIARAGATTLAEVCAIGRPSVLVPYPHAADDHQTKNAEALARAGAAVAIAESALDEAGLASTLGALIQDAERRGAMARAAREHGRPEAAASIVDDLFLWLGGPVERVSRAPAAPKTRNEPSQFGSVDFRVGRGELVLARRTSRPAPAPRLEPFVMPGLAT
jgi:UDP-N-acetylglucosamine--N-acetylmuramyl-(pentapeptide) pyrophosphoryl-undecaprenol N-acetylglucosamine transferase